MSIESVFINCIQEDRALALKIKESLAEIGVNAFLPDEVRSPAQINQIVEKIEAIIQNGGVMLVIINEFSANDNLIISNTQLAFELAEKRTALIILRTKETQNNQTLALYYARAVQINTPKKTTEIIPSIITTVKRMLGLETSKSFIPKRVSKKVITWLTWGLAILALTAGIATYLVERYQEKQEAIKAAQEPVVINVPFTNASIEQGLIVDRRSVPVYQSSDNPEELAPFHIQPKVIIKQITFDNLSFENTLNNLEIHTDESSFISEDQKTIIQHDGVLQLSGIVPDENPITLCATVEHIFSTIDTTYIGIRFRLDEYTDWINMEKRAVSYFRTDDFAIATIDLGLQTISPPEDPSFSKFIGTDWHTLEAVFSSEETAMDVFIDGDFFFRQSDISFDYQLRNLGLVLDLASNNDWMSLFVDEIIFGSDKNPDLAYESEQAEFHFTPVKNSYFNPFENTTLQNINQSDLIAYNNGMMKVNLPPLEFQNTISIEIPTNSISDTNYFALKYRIREKVPVSWTNNGFLEINLRSVGSKNDEFGYRPTITTEFNQAAYSYTFEVNGIERISGSDKNYQQGYWHTMEMVIFPVPSGGADFQMQYWHDGQLVVKKGLSITDRNWNPTEETIVELLLHNGDDLENGIELDIDDITFGFVPTF